MAVETIAEPVERWGGARLPVVRVDGRTGSGEADDAFDSPSIILATLEQLRRVAPSEIADLSVLDRVEFLDDQGFACIPIEYKGERSLFVTGRTPRGVYNGAVNLSEFAIDGGLGAWSGTYMLTHREPGTMRENSTDEGGNDVSNWSLCPAGPKSRDALGPFPARRTSRCR